MTIREAAERLGVSVNAVHKRIRTLKLKPGRERASGWLLLTQAQFEKIKASRDERRKGNGGK